MAAAAFGFKAPATRPDGPLMCRGYLMLADCVALQLEWQVAAAVNPGPGDHESHNLKARSLGCLRGIVSFEEAAFIMELPKRHATSLKGSRFRGIGTVILEL